MIEALQARVRQAASRPGETLLFLVAMAIAAFSLGVAIRFLVVDAVFVGEPDDCRAARGACWIFMANWVEAIIYGFVSREARWTLLLAMAGLAVSLVLLANWTRPRLAVAISVVAWVPVFLALFFPGLPWLPSIQPSQLGGLFLTVTLTWIAIMAGLPVGLGLALMRTSSMPFLRIVATIWIEIGRGLPTIVALFFGITVFPLMTPAGFETDRLMRVMLVFVFLTSALFAEAIRGGLQAVRSEQTEAAWSLGLSGVQSLRLVILPQALAVALPNIVNICVALLKETSLVLVVGLYDLFGIIQGATVDPVWAGESTKLTGYAVAAAAFWVVCSFLSRLAGRLEARLRRGVLVQRTRAT